MKKILKLLLLLVTGLLTSCSPKVKSVITSKQKALSYDAELFVFTEKEIIPDGLKEIGKVSLGDSGFTTKCNYETMLEIAKLQARKIGANVVKITEHKFPSVLGSTCHRLKATLYYMDADKELAKQVNEEPIIEGADYALLHVYRYKGIGPLVSYNLKLGDTTLCRVKNNFKETIKIRKEGLNTIWAKTESKTELPIDVEFGKHYYLRCSVDIGFFVGKPSMEFVDFKTGKDEFESFEAKYDQTKEIK
ncbi:hypothetical protein ACXGQW_04530 [Wenyingzhuangia sp. IMCC45533]